MTPEQSLIELRARVSKEKSNKALDEGMARWFLEDAKKSGKHWILSREVAHEYILSDGKKIKCSHRMPARLSDLSINYPKIFTSEKVGKYTAYRMK